MTLATALFYTLIIPLYISSYENVLVVEDILVPI
jgi:hypothetical protein